MKRSSFVPMLLGLCMLLSACRYDMQDQPKYKPLGRSTFFPDGRMSRPVPAGTIARDELSDKDTVHTGNADGSFVPTIPVPVTKALLERGHDRFDIYCSPCHARTGDGNGMIHQRGFWIPSNLHTERLRSVPPGYLYQVIANGYGAMPDYRDQVPVEDRWAIVAYLRALQLSRHATLADVPQDVRQQLESKGAAPQGTRP